MPESVDIAFLICYVAVMHSISPHKFIYSLVYFAIKCSAKDRMIKTDQAKIAICTLAEIDFNKYVKRELKAD